MDVGSLAGTTSKYEIPLNHLEYSYIETCTDAKHLEKIIRILRAGEEGKYPDLESFAERKLQSLKPNSKVLRKETPIQKITELPRDQQKEIFDDIDSWADEMKSGHIEDQKQCVTNGDIANIATNGTEFPVRGSTVITSTENSQKTKSSGKTEKKTPKRVKPRDYREWDKLDVDAELEKLDENEKPEGKPGKVGQSTVSPMSTAGLPRKVTCEGMGVKDRELKAEREKDKGNEAFRSGDYTEAEVYYTRSLSLVPNIAARNNRAQAYLKLQQWDKAIADTNEVIKQEKDNIKAHLRRGVAFQGKSLFIEAKRDLDKVLRAEPTNKRAKEVMSQLEKSLGEQKTKGRRMMIEESDDDEESESEVTEVASKVTTSTTEDVQQTNGVGLSGDVAQPSPATENQTSESVKISESTLSQSLDGHSTENKGEGSEDGTAGVNSQSEEQPIKEPETEEIDHNGVNVQQTEQPPAAVEPAPPLPDKVIKLKDEANQLFKKGRYAEALDIYNKAMVHIEQDSRQSQNLCVLYSNRAACKMKNGDLKGCIADCDLALTLAPNSVKPLLRRANAYEGLEKYRQAYVDYRQASLWDPSAEVAKQGSTRCQSALHSLDGGKWREKLPAMASVTPPVRTTTTTTTTTSLPTPPVPDQRKKVKVEKLVDKTALFDEQKNQGNEFVKKSDFQSAILCYTKCVELCPRKSVGYTNRALCYLRTNQAKLALQDCEEATRLEPGNVKALFRQGQAYKMLKDYESSERKLRQVIKLEAHNSAAKRELQVVLKYKEEENLKKKKAEPKRKKILIEESSSEESEDERAEPPQNPIAQTGATSQAPDTRSQTQPAVQKVPEQSPKDSSHNPANPSDIPTQNSVYYVGEKMPKTPVVSSLSGDSEKTGNVSASGKSEKKQENSKGKPVHSGKTGSADAKYDLKVPKATSKIRPTAQMNTGSKSTPKSAKASGFEFMSSWSVLKSPEDITPFMDLLLQVQPKQLPSVISNKLEGEMLPIIGKCAGRLAEQGKAETGLEYLKYLTKVPRFQMNTMFMSEPDKKELRSVFKKFKSLKDPAITPSDVDSLYKQYGL